MDFDLGHVKLGQQHDQLKSFCMDFVESILVSPGGPQFLDALRTRILENCGDESTQDDPLEVMMSRFAYLGMMSALDGLGQRMKDRDDLELL